MNNREGLLASVLTHPDEDHFRLIYADCLEEMGMVRLAKFIRLQIEFAKLENGNQWMEEEEINLWGCWPDTDDARTQLRELCPCLSEWVVLPESQISWREPINMSITAVRRGFIHKARGSIAIFENNLASIIREHPVRFVEVTCRRPIRFENRWLFHNADDALHSHFVKGEMRPADHIPGYIFDQLDGFIRRPSRVTDAVRGFEDRQLAIDMLNRAAGPALLKRARDENLFKIA